MLVAESKAKTDEWHRWSDKSWFTQMFQLFPAEGYGQNGDNYLFNFNRLDALRLNIDFRLPRSELKYVADVHAILRKSRIDESYVKELFKRIINMLIKNMKADPARRVNSWMLGQLHNHLRTKVYPDMKSFLYEISSWMIPQRHAWNIALKSGWISTDLVPRGKNPAQREGNTSMDGEEPVKVQGKIRGREREPKQANLSQNPRSPKECDR